jgi:exonuclease III
MYDHSGITINCDGFACPWDSGQVGYIYVSRQKLKDEYGVKRISNAMLERAEHTLRNEVHKMDQYITGDVYGFQVIKRYLDNNNDIKEDIIDSCSGFYGENFKENGMMHYINQDLLIDEL